MIYNSCLGKYAISHQNEMQSEKLFAEYISSKESKLFLCFIDYSIDEMQNISWQ